jgi:UDP-N-acetylglucosamine 2-epimerase (non-hydrolysing)
VGARPNFMKMAPILRAMSLDPDIFEQTLVHTGQHYDANMSQIFFDELEMPRPDVNLEVGSGTHAAQTAEVMQRFEPIVTAYQPDWVFVPGDVNSTLACALVCSKLGIKVAHVEAGLRSFDRTMPEEINRLLTDQLSDLLFTPSLDGDENLAREGIAEEKIHFVGNVMMDTLVKLLPKSEQHWPTLRNTVGTDSYILVTLHRPANVDDAPTLRTIVEALDAVSHEIPVIFPVHPRTRQRILQAEVGPLSKRFQLMEPLGYLDFLALQTHAALVVTDSGGVQEETTFLGVPCLTVRPNTERPVTLTLGSNQLVEANKKQLHDTILEAVRSDSRRGKAPPPLWDGHAADRIVDVMRTLA